MALVVEGEVEEPGDARMLGVEGIPNLLLTHVLDRKSRTLHADLHP